MRKLALLLSLLCPILLVSSAKTVSPGESTTINFLISNPSGSYELCIDSILVQFTDHVGDIQVVTPMPVYPKVCTCPPSSNSSCLSYADAGKAYGQSQGYKYEPSDTFGFIFNITVDPNAASSLVYPGVTHSYEVHYSYKFVSCDVGCWFENPQQESYSDMVYVHGLTQNELILAQSGAQNEQLAASSLAEAQQVFSDASNAIEQANSTIYLSLTARCISISEASAYLSDALGNYSAAKSALNDAQSAYAYQKYDEVKFNATVAKQLAVQTKNDADVATSLIQAELQRIEAISSKMEQANLSVSYSLTLEKQAETIGVSSYEVNSLNSLALAYTNKTNAACKAGEFNAVFDSADSTMEKADAARQILEPLVRDRLVKIYGGYLENLSRARLWIGNLSANYTNLTIYNLTDYRDNIRNGSYADFLIYMESLPSTADIVERTVAGFREVNKTLGLMNNITYLAGKYNQKMNFSKVELLLQDSVEELSLRDFNSSLNFTGEANLELDAMRKELDDKIGKIENAENMIETANAIMSDVSTDKFLIFSPDLSESQLALRRAVDALYSQPERAAGFATQARVLAVEQRRKTESMKLGVAGAVIIIIILAVILSRIKNPFRSKRKPFKYH
ncbi:hypothetical protein H0N99_02545 [Candidatus Micrarchaeota archaeon]|nr:hypothetical protein [Candidatus Micrarchaeota archaeon]